MVPLLRPRLVGQGLKGSTPVGVRGHLRILTIKSTRSDRDRVLGSMFMDWVLLYKVERDRPAASAISFMLKRCNVCNLEG